MAEIVDTLQRVLWHPLLSIYWFIQIILDKILSPNPPPPNAKLSGPKIAVIGAGLTGVSAASHCVGHGFDTVIFEAGDEDSVGGIWTVLILSNLYQATMN
jgi:NADPH-dependent 2,4-dienoyl-CoA reductase/sulfur reductase-like enzyme